MKYLMIAIVYVSLCALIGVSVYFTKSGLPLFALLLAPSFKF